MAPPLIYLIRNKANKAKRRARRDRAVESSRGMATTDPVALICTVRDLSRQVDGIQNLKKLVNLLAE